MTPIASESQQAKNEQSFSAQLRAQAACIDLGQRMPVGAWDYGQGIRRAKGQSFFYELRSKSFCPFGINHPVMLKARMHVPDHEVTVHEFPEHLKAIFPSLTSWRWTIQSPEQVGSPENAYHEAPDLKSNWGWHGFSVLESCDVWVVHLNENLRWVARKVPTSPVAQGPNALEAQSWAKLFLAADVLGPKGRLMEWITHMKQYSWGEWQGLNFSFLPKLSPTEAADSLAQAGIAVDISNEKIQASFGLSMMPADVETIMGTLRAHQG